MRNVCLAATVLVAAAAPARAEVKTATANGFEIEQRQQVEASPAALYKAFADVPRWWSGDHSYSGQAANLSLELRAGGCWCERLPGGGGVEHMRIAYLQPGRKIVLTGALGPLLYEAATGVMQVTVEPRGSGATLVLNYRAAGFANGGAQRLAPVVDKVLQAQLLRLKAFAEKGAGRP